MSQYLLSVHGSVDDEMPNLIGNTVTIRSSRSLTCGDAHGDPSFR